MSTTKQNSIDLSDKKYKKYKYSFRLLILQSPSRSNEKYKALREVLNSEIEELNKRNVKILTEIDEELPFKVYLVGYDGTLKKSYNFNIGTGGAKNKEEAIKNNYLKQLDKILKFIDDMPMSKTDTKKDTKGLSLYTGSTRSSKTNVLQGKTSGRSIEGLGFKDKEKAKYTIEKIKNEPISYQKSVINTMNNRAKYHPNQTKDMKAAMSVYSTWIKENNKESKNKTKKTKN